MKRSKSIQGKTIVQLKGERPYLSEAAKKLLNSQPKRKLYKEVEIRRELELSKRVLKESVYYTKSEEMGLDIYHDELSYNCLTVVHSI